MGDLSRGRSRPRRALACLLALLTACHGGKEGKEPPGIPVHAAPVERSDAPEVVSAVGVVEPIQAVSLVPQVAGAIQGVHFEQGQEVQAGQLLFTIDPRPFEAELRRMEAQLGRTQAQLKNAQAQLERYRQLATKDYASREQLDQAGTAVQVLEAAVKGDQAAVENARLNLDYCYVRAPFDGRAGDILVKAGNIVKANDAASTLSHINQIRPIYVRFSLPETYLNRVRAASAEHPLTVNLLPRQGEKALSEQGVLSFIDNAVDRATGTILLKATFANSQGELWPGQFVNAGLTLAVHRGILMIPAESVQVGQQGEFVFLVRPDQSVEARAIKTSFRAEGKVAVIEGLNGGETVVTEGHLKLFPGARVQIKS